MHEIVVQFALDPSPSKPAELIVVESANSENCVKPLRELQPDAIVVSRTRIMSTKRRLAIIGIIVALTGVFLGRSAGAYLVVDIPERGDAVVVLAGDRNDCRYYRALQVLNAEDSQLLFIDSNIDEIEFGRTLAAQEEEFIRRSAGRLIDQVWVCPIQGDSTDGETKYVQRCLEDRGLDSVVLVTSDFHTRRALSIFRRRLPQYHWSVTAARDQTRFGEKWWRHREWAKTMALEWLKLIWWQTIDRWQKAPGAASTEKRFDRFEE